MAGSISFELSPSVLEWARMSAGYSIEQAAKKAGVSSDRYEAWETGEKLPTYRQLEDLAENVYKRPLAILLLAKPPIEDSIQKDFRSLSNVQIADLSPEIRLALRRAKRYQLILEEVNANGASSLYGSFKISLDDDPLKASVRFRKFVNLSLSEQKSWKSDEAYGNFQKLIESAGIYIFKMKLPMTEVRAFCLTGSFPVVVLNTEDSQNGRIFSLFHEVAHLLLNENDVFKDLEFDKKNIDNLHSSVEEFCNKFSASFLVPDEQFLKDIENNNLKKNKIDDYDIRRLAINYNVSYEVIARKLLFHNIITEDFFWSRKRIWDANAKAAKEKKNESLKEGDGGINQGIKIIFEKGRPYVASVINAYHQGTISTADLSNYLETKLSNLPKINERLNK